MSIYDEIEGLERKLKELRKKTKEKPMDGIPVKDGPWSVFFNGDVGMPMEDGNEYANTLNQFSSMESAKKHSEMMTMWRQALVDNKEGKPIDIDVIRPLLNKGYVAMDRDEKWFWFKNKPFCQESYGKWIATDSDWGLIYFVNLKPAKYWEYSLRRC